MVKLSDVGSRALYEAMIKVAQVWCRDRKVPKLGPFGVCDIPGSVSEEQQFLHDAHKRSLAVTQFKDNDALFLEYSRLVEEFPDLTLSKFGLESLGTNRGQVQAIVGLVNKHSGEIVELDPRIGMWVLLKSSEGFTSQNYSEQWFCSPNGAKADKRDPQFGFDPRVGRAEILRAVGQCDDVIFQHLHPDWTKQVHRILCPCVVPDSGMIWCRTATVVTLGELFLALGKQCTSRQIYALYRTLRIVAVKRRKGQGGKVGVSGSGVQASRSLGEPNTNGRQLCLEFAAATGQTCLASGKQDLNAAIRFFVHMFVG